MGGAYAGGDQGRPGAARLHQAVADAGEDPRPCRGAWRPGPTHARAQARRSPPGGCSGTLHYIMRPGLLSEDKKVRPHGVMEQVESCVVVSELSQARLRTDLTAKILPNMVWWAAEQEWFGSARPGQPSLAPSTGRPR